MPQRQVTCLRALFISTFGLWLSSACGDSGADVAGVGGSGSGAVGASMPGGSSSAGVMTTAGTTSSAGTSIGGGVGPAGGNSPSAGTSAGGAPNSGGSPAGGGSASGGTVAAAGTAATGGSASTGADQCKPIGWATRTGRTGSSATVTGGGTVTPIVVKSKPFVALEGRRVS